jgi:hypothetical protein
MFPWGELVSGHGRPLARAIGTKIWLRTLDTVEQDQQLFR